MVVAVGLRERGEAFFQRLAEHLGLPYSDLDPSGDALLDSEACALLDARAARALSVLPLAFDGERLVVACSRPPDEQLRGALRAVTKREASFVICAPEPLERARERLSGRPRLLRPQAPERTPAPTEQAIESEAAERRRFADLAERAGLAFVELTLSEVAGSKDPVNHAAAQMLSADLCRRLDVLPISSHRGVVTVATVNPFDELALRVVLAQSGRRPRVVVAAPRDLERAITRVFGPVGQPLRSLTGLGPGARVRRFGRRAEVAEVAVAVEPMLLGEYFVEQGTVSGEQVREALATQQRSGGRIGEVLLHSGAIDERTLARALSDQLRLPLLDVAEFEPDPEALDIVPEPLARRFRFAPLAVRDGALYLAMADPLDDDAYAALKEHTRLPIRSVVSSRSSVERLMQRLYSGRYVEVAVAELLNRAPEESAYRVLTGAQKLLFGIVAFLIVLLFVRDPVGTVIAFNVVSIIFYASVSGYKLKLMYDALNHSLELPVRSEEVVALDERTLPVYTILVPLYREADVVPRLVDSIARLDYPRTKLDIKLIVEEDDEETIAAIRDLRLPAHFRLVVVPDAQPKTKPKACNYGLIQAEGRFVVIFDAEDRPEADQLKKVVLAFRKADARVVCIQCKLNYFNRSQNILTRWFTSEYSNWFDLMMPGLDATDAPIPLGGTSNHFVTDRLIELGAWDPFNVTEDADLGIRLHKAGYKTAIIDSTTYEEANSDLYNWIRQRSRWVKGYVQTWLVHMRHPVRLIHQVGLRSWFSFQLVVAGTFVGFLLNPFYWLLTSLWILTEADLIRTLFPGFVFYAAALGLFVGNFSFTYINVAGSMRRGYYDLVKYSLLSPLYWALMSVGALKGFLQLFYRPFYWEKTVHGLDIGTLSQSDSAVKAR